MWVPSSTRLHDRQSSALEYHRDIDLNARLVERAEFYINPATSKPLVWDRILTNSSKKPMSFLIKTIFKIVINGSLRIRPVSPFGPTLEIPSNHKRTIAWAEIFSLIYFWATLCAAFVGNHSVYHKSPFLHKLSYHLDSSSVKSIQIAEIICLVTMFSIGENESQIQTALRAAFAKVILPQKSAAWFFDK